MVKPAVDRAILLREWASPANKVACFVVAGALVFSVWLYKILALPRPFWIFADDIETDYFFRSLALASGYKPNFWHPGVPASLLGAAIVRMLHAGPGDFQLFLSVAYAITGVLLLAALAGISMSLFTRETPTLMGTAILLSFFVHPSAFTFLSYWGAPSFILPMGFLAFWALYRTLESPVVSSDSRISAAFASGICGGLACSLVLVFAPIVIGGIVGLTVRVLTTAGRDPKPPGQHSPRVKYSRLMRTNLQYVGGAVIGWLSGTLFLPGASWWGIFILKASATATQIQPGQVSTLSALGMNLWYLVSRTPVWSILLLVTIAALVQTIVRLAKDRNRPEVASLLAMAAASLTMISIGGVAGLRIGDFGAHAGDHGVSVRYLLPVAAMVTLTLAWLSRVRAEIGRGRVPILDHLHSLGFVGLVFIGFGMASVQDIAVHRETVSRGRSENLAFESKLLEESKRLGRKARLLMWGVSVPSWSVRWGNHFARSLFTREIDAIYPDEALFDIREWRRGVPPAKDISNFDIIVIAQGEINETEVGDVGRFYSYLRSLGTLENWNQGLRNPLVVVHVKKSP